MPRLIWIVLLVLSVAALVIAVVAGRLIYFVAPFAVTREPERLAALLHLRPGARVADIGAGDGAMAEAIARRIGPSGSLLATEVSAERRADLARRARRIGGHFRVVEATAAATGLPPGACDAIYMRAVFHHIEDRPGFAGQVAAAVKPGGRLVVIDFPPGGLPFHGADHGVTAAAVVAAFQAAGWSVEAQVDRWGGGMFAVAFRK